MAGIPVRKSVKAGKWRTLESGWNAPFICSFSFPVGAKVKVRYGGGGWFGWDSQKKTLDGSPKSVSVSRYKGLAYARVQIRVESNTEVSYTYYPTGRPVGIEFEI